MLIRIALLFTVSCSINAAECGNVKVKEITSIDDSGTFKANIEGWADIIS